LFVTPLTAAKIFGKNGIISQKNTVCCNIVIDKINLHQAFDLDQDLIELVQNCQNFPKQDNLICRTVITTNNKTENPLEDDA
tara:strand:+ start:616 stop:861 length:246 start_codon:yes stop_codon:yes gene_type:complete